MFCIYRPDTDPYFNIAAEEYVLKNYTDDIIMLWKNQASVIIGKHQNTFVEINHHFVEENHIPVIRRISGGGTVFHDLNNINYTLIRTVERRDRLIDFKDFLKPVIGFLETIGIKAVFEGKNNLSLNGRKISGNSAHVYKNRVLHHGTLLFDSQLETLENAIKTSDFNIEDKAVKSIRKVVANIADHLQNQITTAEFKQLLQEYLLKYHKINQVVSLNETDQNAINQLVQEKYKTWNWNFGYSPKFIFQNQTKLGKLILEVKNGYIIRIVFEDNKDLSHKLLGLPYRKKEILEMLNQHLADQNKVDEYSNLFGF